VQIKRGQVVSFELPKGRRIGPNYEVLQLLGAGSEGEVYQVTELETGIHRAAKLYFPHINPRGRRAVWYAHKLNKLRNCDVVLQYYHTQEIQISRQRILCLISEFCDGIPVEQWALKQRGGRLHPFIALHVLYGLAKGLEAVHAVGEYHADVHSQNILIQPRGVGFILKLLDFYDWGRRARFKQHQDIVDCVHVLHEMLGGAARYRTLSREVRYIIAGLQRTRILQRFPTMSALRLHLETFDWQAL
jgi:hypothetical protein